MNTTAAVQEQEQVQETVTQQDVVTEDLEPTPQDATQHIEAVNPTSEEMVGICDHIETNYDFKVDTKAVKFKFKRSIDKETKIETVREAITLAIPYPSVQGIVDIMKTGGLGLELLREAVGNVINSFARDILYEDAKGELTAATFPIEKLSWDAISKIPKVQRRVSGIAKDTWDAFAVDYCEVMPAAADKNVDQVAKAAKILVAKLIPVRTVPAILQMLIGQLAIYAENSPKIEEFAECVSFLINKAEDFLNVSDEDLLANL